MSKEIFQNILADMQILHSYVIDGKNYEAIKCLEDLMGHVHNQYHDSSEQSSSPAKTSINTSKEILITYLKLKLEQEDWHGVWDSAIDLQRLQDKEDIG